MAERAHKPRTHPTVNPGRRRSLLRKLAFGPSQPAVLNESTGRGGLPLQEGACSPDPSVLTDQYEMGAGNSVKLILTPLLVRSMHFWIAEGIGLF